MKIQKNLRIHPFSPHSPKIGRGGLHLLLLLLGAPLASMAQPDPDGFNPGTDGEIYALALQADGKVLVGGGFSTLGGQSRTNIGRLNADGTPDPSFNPGTDGAIYALAVQADGKVLVAGGFSTLGGQSRTNFGRLNLDGTLDSTFDPGGNGYAPVMAVQADAKILVAGYGAYIKRLNANGSVDMSFNPRSADPTSYNSRVNGLMVQADGRILVWGSFAWGGQSYVNLGRLNADGTLDGSFNPGGALDYSFSGVDCLALQADGKVLVGGSFSTLPTLGDQYPLRRLNADGTLDSSFNAGPSGIYYPGVSSLAVQADGKILVSGTFATLGGESRYNIGRLNADGTADTSFNSGTLESVYSLALQADGKTLVAGRFTWLGGESRNSIGRLNSSNPATQALASDGSTLTWTRGDTSPEVWRTTFESSPDGTNWTNLGAGSRIPGGWQAAELALPTNATVRARGYTAGGYQNGSAWFVETAIGSPAIEEQPASLTNNPGTTAAFTVYAIGSEPLTYHWRKDGQKLIDGGNLSGAATASLTLSNVLGGDAGRYSVVISNAAGSVTSLGAMLTVIDPLITAQTASQNKNPGDSVTFSLAATGTPPLIYQWRKDGVTQAGATQSSFTLTNLRRADAGSYDAVVSSVWGSVASTAAVLSVNVALGTPTSAPSTNWNSIASSADGRKLVAVAGDNNTSGAIYTSKDSGATWTQATAPNKSWKCVVSSADGSKVAAGSYHGGIYTSADSGATWTVTSAPNDYWWSTASSADGSKLVAGGLYLYTSTNAGATWTQTSSLAGGWYSVASSADGTKLVAANYYSAAIYTSRDSGATWVAAVAPGRDWSAVSSSADGTKLVATAYPGNGYETGAIYTSADSGATWTAAGLPGTPVTYWQGVASSADGTKVVAVAYAGFVYISADSGATWTQTSAPKTNWSSVAASADGTRWAATIYGGGIYTFHAATPEILTQPAGQVVPAGSQVTFSVGAIGALPLAYQWTSNNVSLPGATNSTLTLSSVTLAESGSRYAVLVSNSLGSALSANALLTVVPALVTTGPAAGVSAASELLSGSVILEGESVAWFEWGTDAGYGHVAGVTVLAGQGSALTVTNLLTGLNGGDLYHYRLVAADDFGIVYGNDQSFIAGLIPTAITLPASGITLNGATLNATVNPNGPDTTVYFRWGIAANYYPYATPSVDLGKGPSPVNFNSRLSGLAPGTIYHYQIVASNILGQVNGADVSLLTGPWSATSVPAMNWDSVASSADGSVLAAVANPGPIYLSTNSGVTWMQASAPTGQWETVACSADGRRLIAAAGGGTDLRGPIYTSADSGASWTSNSAPIQNWQSVASSADGGTLVAAASYDRLIYVSTNSGANWNLTGAPSNYWTAVCSSADGTKLAAAAGGYSYYGVGPGPIYTSTNSGITWRSNSAPGEYWSSIVSSADGIKLVAAAAGFAGTGPIYASKDAGATWLPTSAPLAQWLYLASSANGTKLAAVAPGLGLTQIITSTDSGVTWRASTITLPTQEWNAVASSADGARLVVTVGYPSTGSIYTLQTTPKPLLNLTLSGGNALLSWIIPSMDFTLQQNSDLTTTNWTDVSTPSVLNLTNLQNQVMVSPTNGSAFFRLKH